MGLYILQEPSFAGTAWSKQILDGLLFEIKKRRLPHTFLQDAREICCKTLREDDAIIIIATGIYYLEEALASCYEVARGKIIVLSNRSNSLKSYEYNLVSSDIFDSVKLVSEYLSECKRKSIALYGMNPNSLSDNEVTKNFLQIYKEDASIFSNDGSLSRCFELFYPKIELFDTVICANDYAAVSLLRLLKQKGYRDISKLFIISYTNTLLGGMFSPSVTSVSRRFSEYGKAAMEIYRCIQKEFTFSSVNINVGWNLDVRETTAKISLLQSFSPFASAKKDTEKFYNDPEIIEMMGLENILCEYAGTEPELLLLLRDGKTYDEISEKLYISINGVKYKVKNMMELCSAKSKSELVSLLKKYL